MRVRLVPLLLVGVAALLWGATPAHAKGPDAAAAVHAAARGADTPVWPVVAVIGGVAASIGVLTAVRHNRRRRTHLAAA